MWIDAHAHLYDLSGAELDGCIARSRAAGLAAIVNASTSIANAPTVIDQCAVDPLLWAVVGISPFDVLDLPRGWDSALAALLNRPGVIGIGEVGLDDSNPRYPPLDSQIPVFERFCAMAAATGLPLVMHSRGAEERVIAMCRDHGIRHAIFHCFTGDLAALGRILDNGWHVSFSGIVTFPGNELSAAVRYTPADRLLIETDSPYLAPVPFRGRPNEPARVTLVGEAVARLKEIGPVDLAQQIGRTFQTIFGQSLSVKQSQ
jgi:TatD DNase family protein